MRIHGADLVRVERHRSAIENELMAEEIRNVIALCVGSFVVGLAVWLS